jgi:uncharacterized membrane-anchored protein YhcB (DUF1043 family)
MDLQSLYDVLRSPIVIYPAIGLVAGAIAGYLTARIPESFVERRRPTTHSKELDEIQGGISNRITKMFASHSDNLDELE